MSRPADCRFVARYEAKEDQETAMKDMAKQYTEDPHVSFMNITKEFRVAFSRDLEMQKG